MRGPLVFLASLAAVAGLGAAFVLPAHRERQRLPAGRAATAPAGPGTASLPPPAESVAAGLRALLDGGGEGSEPGARAAALAEGLGARVEDRRPDGVTFRTTWNRLPPVLVALADPASPTLDSLVAVPAEAPEECRVTIRFAPLPPAPEGR